MVFDGNFNRSAGGQALRLPKSIKLPPKKRVLGPAIAQGKGGEALPSICCAAQFCTIYLTANIISSDSLNRLLSPNLCMLYAKQL